MKIELITSLADITDSGGHAIEAWQMKSIPADVAALLGITGADLVRMVCNDPSANRTPRYDDKDGGKKWRETTENEKLNIAVLRLFGNVDRGYLKLNEKLNMKCVWAVLNYAKNNQLSVLELKPHDPTKTKLETLESAL